MATSPKIKRRDVLLLLIYSPTEEDDFNSPICGRTRISKMMFLFQNEVYKDFKADLEDPAIFKSWNFGPWSEDIFKDIEFFKSIGFVQTKIESIKGGGVTQEEADEFEKWEIDVSLSEYEINEYQQESFFLTDLGKKYIKEKKLFESLSENQKLILRRFKNKFNNASLFSILQYVYRNYPKTIEKSRIKNKILNQSNA